MRSTPLETGLDDGDDPDGGSAMVEFSVLAVVLLVPILVFVGVLAQAQAASFAAVSAAQQGTQVIAQTPPEELSLSQVESAARLPPDDHGIAAEDVDITVTCADGACTEAGAVATVTAVVSVELPSIPFIGALRIAQMEHSSTVVVGRYA
ncbi:hypothetical protein FCK90_00845 [Kocuria coralli]|uniref:Pilus assembly protein n=1 Tax=Kocuria coralli TaxID=1461025 RepID=A0A5J5L3E2_9MICC|nr:hypothetical protein [Kocuria coralli]KAA9395606.1 hypothetical protein FCK90_00845 [Kocuria coralli]